MAYDPIIFNSNPYYDDFDSNLGFLKVLFRPGYPLQARELTQIQSILQNQVSKIGDHLFKDGSRIVGSGIGVRTTSTARISVPSLDAAGITDYSELIGKQISTTTAKAKIVAFSPLSSGGSSSQLLTSVNFISGSNFATGGVSFGTLSLTLVESSKTAKVVTVSDGLFYIDGFFVPVGLQSFIPTRVVGSTLDSVFYGTQSFSDLSTRIGFFIERDTVTSREDLSLLDPAIGSSNYNAPGGDRYKINLILGQSGITAQTNDFLELLRIENGDITKKLEKITYAEIEKTLARRTYEESGSYVVNPFDISVKDAGVSLDISFGSGKAYILGHEIETQYPQKVSISKARTTREETAVTFPYSIGNYIGISMSGVSLGVTLAANIELSSSSSAIINFRNSTGSVVASGYIHGVVPVSTGVSYSQLANVYVYGLSGSVVGASSGVLYATSGGVTLCEFGPISGTTFGKIEESNTQSLVYEITPGYAISDITAITVPGKIWADCVITSAGASTATFTVGATEITNEGFSSTYYKLVTGVQYSDIALMNSKGIIFYPQNATGNLANQSAPTGSDVSTSFSATSGLSAGFTSGAVKMLVPLIYTVNPLVTSSFRTKTSSSFTDQNISWSDGTRRFEENGRGVIVSSQNDVYSISSVIHTSAGGGTLDITDYVELDDGQKETYYDKSRLIVKPSKQTAWLAGVTGGSITITGKYFAHGGLAGAPFVGATSYIGVSYENIPLFTNTRTGKTVSLANCLDFRHTGITSASPLIKPYLSSKVSTITYKHYLPRIDKISLRKNKENNSAEFLISSGTPDLSPVSVSNFSDSLVLGNLSIPSYTHNPSDVLFTPQENKRFTMEDIGAIQKRIDDIEVFAKLSLSEVETESRSLKLSLGSSTEPIKTSIFSEEFIGHSIGDVASSDYICSVDFEKGELQPFYTPTDIVLTKSTTNGCTMSSDELLTNGYTITNYIENNQWTKTIVVNPSDTINWLGFASLNKEVSGVFDLSYRPISVANSMGENDNWLANNANNARGFGTQWNDWSSFWSGIRDISREQEDIQKQNLKTPHIKSTSIVPNINSGNVLAAVERTIIGIDENLSSRLRINRIKNRVKIKVQDKIVDRTVVPYIPATGFTLSVAGLKPNTTNLSVYFDGTEVKTGISCDSYGSCGVTFSITAGTFLTGEKLVRISDSSTSENSTTSADVVYRCQGILKQRDSGSYSTRPPHLRKQTVSHETIVKDPFSRDSSGDILENTQWSDPLSQTFFVDAKSNPQGIFIKNVTLYFYAKDSTLPVTIQIRPTINGYPSPSVVIPFSTKTILSDDVVIGDPDPLGTVFTFSSPVFLEPGEYSICVLVNSNEYKLYASDTGFNAISGGDSTGGRVGGNSRVGVLFTPSSIGPANVDNSTDLMFSIGRCLFTSGGSQEFTTTNFVNAQVLHMSTSELIPDGCSIVREYAGTSNLAFNNNESIYPSPLLGSPPAPNIDFTLYGTPDVSPVVDMQSFFGRSVSMRCGSSGTSSYVSRVISVDSTLSNGVVVYSDMSIPSGATASLYYRATESGNSDILNKAWSYLPALTTPIVASSDIDYSEVTYGITLSNSFSSYQLKLDIGGTATPQYKNTPKVRSIKGISFVV